MTTCKLTLDLVPSTCWFSNVRSCVSKKRWDKIKSRVCSQAWDTCQICGGVGPRHPVECHEVWSYDDTKQIQKLVGMVALCPACHQVKHFGLAQIKGKGEVALQHLMQVNQWTQKRAEKHIKESFERWAERSKKKWKLDISHLSDYGIDVAEIKEPR